MDGYRIGIGAEIAPLARTFFATFSRFEFALKRGDFALGEIGKPANPNWDAFAAKLGQSFFLEIQAAKAAAIFFDKPPKKLMVKGGGDVDFEEVPVAVNAQQLFEAVRLVRNNLFHGEKVYVGKRDEDLMNAGLSVLDAAFAAATQIRDCDRMTMAFAYAPVNPH